MTDDEILAVYDTHGLEPCRGVLWRRVPRHLPAKKSAGTQIQCCPIGALFLDKFGVHALSHALSHVATTDEAADKIGLSLDERRAIVSDFDGRTSELWKKLRSVFPRAPL